MLFIASLYLSLVFSTNETPKEPNCARNIRAITISLLGAPASSKGTIARLLDGTQFSIGEALRREIQLGDPVAIEAEPFMKRGVLVPEKHRAHVVKLFFRSLKPDAVLVLDGIPRKPDEIGKMNATLGEVGRKIDIAFYFRASKETCLLRIIHRWTCPTCQRTYHAINRRSRYKDVCEHCEYSFLMRRKDDTPEGFETRWNVFVQETGQVLFELGHRGILFTIDAEKSVHEILDEVIRTVESRTGVRLKILDAATQLPE